MIPGPVLGRKEPIPIIINNEKTDQGFDKFQIKSIAIPIHQICKSINGNKNKGSIVKNMRFVYLRNKSKKINKQEIVEEHLRPIPCNESPCRGRIKFFKVVNIGDIINRVFLFNIIGPPSCWHKPNS